MDASAIGKALDSTKRQQIGPSASSPASPSECKIAAGKEVVEGHRKMTVRRLKHHKDTTVSVEEKGMGSNRGGRQVPEERRQNQLSSNSTNTSHHEWAAHSPVKY